MTSIKELEGRVSKIEKRNKKVETDKAWELSWSRKLLLFSFTYLAIGLYLDAIGVLRPWLNAIVPAVGFLLSTFSLPFFRRLWEKYLNK